VTSPVLDPEVVRRVVDAALEEDLGAGGDLTASAVVPEGRRARGSIVAREDLVVAGVPVALEIFRRLDPALAPVAAAAEGARVSRGAAVLVVEARARALLSGERSALNVLQRMCGIATAARAAVDEVAGTGVAVLDTRKTAPGLRRLDKYAVACGGATNHRMGLYDAVMIKDTHVAAAGPLGLAILRALAHGHPRRDVTAEVGTVDGLEEAIEAGAGRVLLDNMSPAALRECVRRAGGRVVLEASGGLKPGGLREVAATGVDCLSLGWLTHSVRAADLAMDLEALA
jgi:nicotinate-nucleotide pyrophosphorylase (carboxylating)